MANFLKITNGYARLSAETGLPAIYDVSVAVVSTTTSGTSYTLPSSGSYVGDELEIFLDGQELDSGTDYAFVGSGTKTQVQFTFDLLAGDNIRFRKLRGP